MQWYISSSFHSLINVQPVKISYKMLNLAFFVTIFFGYAFADITNYSRYVNCELTEEQILEELKKNPIVSNDKPPWWWFDIELCPEYNVELCPEYVLIRDKEIQEILQKVAKETKKTTTETSEPYFFRGSRTFGWCRRRKRDAASVPERKTQTETATEKYTYSDFLYYSHLLLILFGYAFKN